ncbi:MAG: hypothetical protein COA45_03790 [Zetaproteobacteria bacterium]|nr:MAG: hypothetical protein COA45_03790 [Zetaproteobacteria bacterium]
MISHKLSSDGVLILLFHGVIKENNYQVRNYIRKHIEAEFFHDILVDLKAHGSCLSMDEVIDFHHNGQGYPANSFAITFDDGFENNYSVAAPILNALDLPSTFYITTDFIENGTMSWTDQAEYALENMPHVTCDLVLPWNNQSMSIASRLDKINLMKAMRQYIFADETRDPQMIIDWLYKALGMVCVQTTDDPLDKKLSWAQIQEMNKNPLFTFGGHTHTHPIMSGLSTKNLDYEIDTSLRLLKEKGGIENHHYAYPQGRENHYSKTVIEALKLRGITCCPTAIDGINTAQTGLFDLYRYMVDAQR